MRDFDERWSELASSARRAERVEPPLSKDDAERFAAPARRTARTEPQSRARRNELLCLAATAAIVLVTLACLVPDASTLLRWRGETTSELASLSRRVPSAPRLPPPSIAFEIVPDLPAWLVDSFDVETAR